MWNPRGVQEKKGSQWGREHRVFSGKKGNCYGVDKALYVTIAPSMYRSNGILVGPEYLKCKKILSETAKTIISRATDSGKYSEIGEAVREPPFMAPCADPKEYPDVRILCSLYRKPATDDQPKWCSLCNDFGELLVLCAGCRVAICSQTIDSSAGCLGWNKDTGKDSFVFYCPYCRTRKSKTGGNKSSCEVRI